MSRVCQVCIDERPKVDEVETREGGRYQEYRVSHGTCLLEKEREEVPQLENEIENLAGDVSSLEDKVRALEEENSVLLKQKTEANRVLTKIINAVQELPE